MGNAKDNHKTPRSSRFRKGQSGNPRGRPRKRPEAKTSAFDVVIDRTLTITQGGVAREVTVDEALQHKTYQAAIAGDRAARREVLKMIAKREKAMAVKAPAFAPAEMKVQKEDPTNADDALLILGIARPDPRWSGQSASDKRERLLLETWAVKAALSRRSARKMTGRELAEARRCTHDAGSIRWPEAEEE